MASDALVDADAWTELPRQNKLGFCKHTNDTGVAIHSSGANCLQLLALSIILA